MTPQRSVATISHQRNASRSTVGTRGLLVGGQEALDAAEAARAERLRGAEPPGPDAEPGQVLVDLADVHQLPVQHGGQAGRRRRSGCPSGSRRAPAAAATAAGRLAASQRNAHSNVAVVSPISSSRSRHSASWSVCVEADPVRVGAVDRGQRLRALPQQPVAAGVVEVCGECAGRSSRRAIASQMRNGLPSAAGELSAARMWGTGAPAAAARRWTPASSSMPAWTSSGGPVRRISAPAAAFRRPRRTPTWCGWRHRSTCVRFSTCSPRRGPAAGPSAQLARFTCGRTRTAAGPPGGSGSPRRPR